MFYPYHDVIADIFCMLYSVCWSDHYLSCYFIFAPVIAMMLALI